MREHIMAILGGVLAGVVAVTAIEMISYYRYPFPPGLDVNDREAMRAHLAAQPPGAYLLVLAAHAVGSFVGGAVTAIVSRRKAYDRALVIGLLLMVAGMMTLLSMPHPTWFALADVVLYVPLALVGCFVAGSLWDTARRT